jgi:hypothetical protein
MLKAASGNQRIEERDAHPQFTSRSVTIKPGGMKSVGLGVYGAQAEQPTFTLTFTPDLGEQIGASLDRLDIPGKSKYMLLYQFRNNSDKDCTVEVRQQA